MSERSQRVNRQFAENTYDDFESPWDRTPGKRASTNHVNRSQVMVMRVADADAFGPRDSNGVAAAADREVAKASSSTGQPLPGAIKSRFEGSLGADLSRVRVHTGAQSAQASKALGAKAYTVGDDVHMGAGQYKPNDPAGLHLLAHEVAHTVQQSGAAQAPQTKLEVSGPGDAMEVEADRAADAMVKGQPASVGVSTWVGRVIARDMADDMEQQASYEEAMAIQNPPILLGEASSVDSTAQARAAMSKVSSGTATLYHRKAFYERKKKEAWTHGPKKKYDGFVVETDSKISANDGVIKSLQKIVDLGTGHAQVDNEGHRAGYDTRAGAFAALYATAVADFARIQGVVRAFLGKNKVNAPNEGDMGRAMATGDTNGDTKEAHGKVNETLNKKGNEKLKKLVGSLETSVEQYESANYADTVNTQIGTFTGAVTGMKNVQLKQELNPEYEDSAKQAAAKAKVAKVQADLNAAKAGIDKAGQVITLATTALGAPAIGALGEASALTQGIDKIKKIPKVETGLKAAKAGGDLISGTIKEEVAKLMTNYTERIDKANGDLQAANADKAYKVLQLDKGELAKAQGDVNAAVTELVKTLDKMKREKDAIRDLASQIRVEQEKSGNKDGPDIAGMSRAVAECTTFVETAKTAIKQGDEEQKLAKEIADERKKVAGEWKKGNDERTMFDENGGMYKEHEQVTASQDAYYECEGSEPFAITKKPIKFSIWSDSAIENPEIATGAIKPKLEQLKADLQTVEADKIALKNAMFGAKG